MNRDIFLSHSSADKPVADAVCAAIERHGIRCWIAPRDIVPGTDWSEAIVGALLETRLTVLVFSGRSNTSPQVRREVQFTFEHGRTVVPLRIDDAMPEGTMAYYLSPVHWLNALTPPLEPHIETLVSVVRQMLATDRETGRQGDGATGRLEGDGQPRPVAPSPSVAPSPPPPPPAAASNLPAPATSFVGREAEVAAARERLRKPDVRLISFLGPGGIGKTRLALEVATELAAEFEHGVFFVPLGEISDAELVGPSIAQTLGVHEQSGRPIKESLKEFLRERASLLVLDNFEQVLEAAHLVAEVLAAAPRLKVLVSSRAPLQVRGEQSFPVEPLGLPDLRRLPPVPELLQFPAVELFRQRAASHKPDFAVTEENARTVAEICRRLDGLPLAIELAAARIRLFPPPALLSRLENRLKLLTGGARDLPARQQTLRGAISWSYDLLDEGEKALFRRLCVFAGGCTLEAAEMVCSGLEEDPAVSGLEALEIDALDGVGSLVDKSLLWQTEGKEGEPRFDILPTIREFGRECLAGNKAEEEALRRQHAQFFKTLALEAEQELRGASQKVWLDRLETEHDNLRAAIDWAVEKGETEDGLAMGGALWPFWSLRGHWTEGRQRLEALLALEAGDVQGYAAENTRALARANALSGAGELAFEQGAYEEARAFHEESLAIGRELGDRRQVARALSHLANLAATSGEYDRERAYREESLPIWRELGDKQGIAYHLLGLAWAAWYQGDYTGARAHAEEGLAMQRQLGDQWHIPYSLDFLGIMACAQGEYETARPLHEEGLKIRQALGDKGGITDSLNNLANVAFRLGDLEEARTLYQESLALARELGNKQDIGTALVNMSIVAQRQDDAAAAVELCRESLRLFWELGNKTCIPDCLETLAYAAACGGGAAPNGAGPPAEQAARRFGAAQALREAIGAPRAPADVPEYEQQLAIVRAELGEEGFAAAWARGQAMSPEEAVMEALGEPLPRAAALAGKAD